MVRTQDFPKSDSVKSDSPTTLFEYYSRLVCLLTVRIFNLLCFFWSICFHFKRWCFGVPKTVQGEDDEVLSETVLTASQLRLSGIASYSCQTN